MKTTLAQSLNSLALLILNIFLYFNPISSYTFSYSGTSYSITSSNISPIGGYLRDLEYSGAAFQTEANAWTASLLVTAGVKTYLCGTVDLLGGYNILGGDKNQYFQRIYTGLPPHNLISVSFLFYAMDSWDGTTADDHFEMSFDGDVKYAWKLSGFAGYATALCGNPSYTDYPPIQVKVNVPHTPSTLTFRIINQLDQVSYDESLAFRDISMIFMNVANPEYTLCGVADGSPLPDKMCACSATNMYMDPPNSGRCLYCASSCATCTGPDTTQCTTCPTGQYLVNSNACYPNCNYPLSVGSSTSGTTCYTPCSGSYAYWDASCSSSCTSPLEITTYNTFSLCTYKCSLSQYLYWNGTCADSCNTPLSTRVTKSRNFCDYPCTGSDILYWNTSCKGSCNAPLVKRLEAGKYYCDYPCASSEFLYWNGSCKATCNSPLKTRVEAGKNYCDYPCTGSDILYWNGSCIASCLSPLSPRSESGKNYCDYPCTGSDILYWNTSCKASCPFPLSTRLEMGKYYCDYPCTGSDYLYWNASCKTGCASPLSTRQEAGKNYCDYPCTGSDILYWNTSCKPACAFPLSPRQEAGKYYCEYPCAASENLYWNGSCKANCPSPLSTRVEAGKNYCDYPCTGSDILYWNTSCISSCPLPLSTRQEAGKYYCDYPCQLSQYLYFNTSCFGSCPIPLHTRVEASRNYCDYPCTGTDTLRWDGTCIPSCNFPLHPRVEATKNYCDYPCQLSQRLFWNGSCLTDTECPFPLSMRTEFSRNFCDYPCTGTEYLLWNGTCKASCSVPFSARISYGDRYCDYPCDTAQTLYWDGMCSSNCASPAVPKIEGNPMVRNFCTFPCKLNEFLYWDGNCSTSCQFPLRTKIQNSRLFCQYPCDTSEYLYWNGTCRSSCEIPFKPRTEGSQKYCDYPCSSSEYLYWNGSCISTCDAPLSTRTQGNDKFCDYSCDSSQFLYWDGSCSSDCNSPLTPTTLGSILPRKFCVFGCETSEALYWDKTCSSECKSPLVQIRQKNRRFCQYPCQANEYLYWNGTCKTSCDSPLSPREEQDGNKYCDYPCQQSEYLYWNTSCISECNSPLTTRIENGKNYCDYKCQPEEHLDYNGRCLENCAQPFTSKIEGDTIKRNFCLVNCEPNEFLHWNGSCLPQCDSPYNKVFDGNIYKLCYLPCLSLSSYYYIESGTCNETCVSPLVINNDELYPRCTPVPPANAKATLFSMFLDAPLGGGTLTVVKVVKAMQYMRYLDIKLPPRLQRLGVSRGRNVATMGSGARLLNEMQSNLIKETLPSVFSKHNFKSSFLENFWDSLLFLAAALISGIVCYFFEKIAQKAGWGLVESIFMRLRVITKWNLFLMMMATNIDDIILYSSIEFRTVEITSSSAFSDHIGLVLCIICLILSLGLMILTYYVVEKLQKLKVSVLPASYHKDSQIKEFTSKWEDFQVFYRGLRDNNSLNQYFFLIYTLRIGLPMLVTVCVTSLPLLIIIFQLVVNCSVLFYMLKEKPFKKRINFVQLVFYELVVLMMNVCMLLLVIFNEAGIEADDASIVLGDIVIIGNDILNILTVPFAIIKMKQEFDVIRRLQKTCPEKGYKAKTRYIQLFSLVFQQANMGFEELIEEAPNQAETRSVVKLQPVLSDKELEMKARELALKQQAKQAKNRKIVPFDDKSEENLDNTVGKASLLSNKKGEMTNLDITDRQVQNTAEDFLARPVKRIKPRLPIRRDNESPKLQLQEGDPLNSEFSPVTSPVFGSRLSISQSRGSDDLTQTGDSVLAYKRDIRRLLKGRPVTKSPMQS